MATTFYTKFDGTPDGQKNLRRINSEIASNVNQFTKQLSELSKFIKVDIEQVIKEIISDLFLTLASRNPVDTGYSRDNWNIKTSYNANDLLDKELYKDKSTIQRGMITEINRLEVDDFVGSFTLNDKVIHIYNNANYVSFLEEGSSTQAPDGFVRITLAEFNQRLQKILNKYIELEYF